MVQDISNTLWAYATLRHYPGAELLNGAAQQAIFTIHRFKPQEVANTLWSYATLGHDPNNLLLDAMAGQMAHSILHFRPQVSANPSCSLPYRQVAWLLSAHVVKPVYKQTTCCARSLLFLMAVLLLACSATAYVRTSSICVVFVAWGSTGCQEAVQNIVKQCMSTLHLGTHSSI